MTINLHKNGHNCHDYFLESQLQSLKILLKKVNKKYSRQVPSLTIMKIVNFALIFVYVNPICNIKPVANTLRTKG